MNETIQALKKTKATHLWIVDADIEVPVDGLCKLLCLDVDIASGIYPRHDGGFAMAGILSENDPFHYQPLKTTDLFNQIIGERERVAAGNGCLLIKKRVFEQYSQYYEPLHFRGGTGRASDLTFFYEAQKLGFTARIHGGCICGHLPEYPLSDIEKWMRKP